MLEVKLSILLKITSTLLLIALFNSCYSYQQDLLQLKTESIHLDLHHKFGLNQDFKPRGSIHIKPRTEYRAGQATISNVKLSDEDLKALKEASASGDTYFLRATLRKKGTDSDTSVKTTQTLVKACSIYTSNLADFITVNLSPINEFINVNLFTTDPECTVQQPNSLAQSFNTTVIVDSASVGPIPDTATYIKRLEEERQNKMREGKEDNRSFFAKYWIYIVPAVIILMMFSGPADQASR